MVLTSPSTIAGAYSDGPGSALGIWKSSGPNSAGLVVRDFPWEVVGGDRQGRTLLISYF